MNLDLQVHSATKFFSGHADCAGGLVCVRDPEVSKEKMKVSMDRSWQFHGIFTDSHNIRIIRINKIWVFLLTFGVWAGFFLPRRS